MCPPRVSSPGPSRAPDRKDSTPRHGRLLHPSSWAERDDRDHAAENFFQGGSPKQATPLTASATSLTTKNRFTPHFRGWGLDGNFKPKSPPYPGGHYRGSAARQNEVGLAARTRPGASILHCDCDALHKAAPPFTTVQKKSISYTIGDAQARFSRMKSTSKKRTPSIV